MDSADITFLYQGKFEKNTNCSIRLTRKYFPESKIVLSCWEGDEDLIEEKVDILVLNTDPGCEFIDGFKVDNLNRQIISTANGLDMVTTKYVCKLRTDSYLASDKIKILYDKYSSNAYSSKKFTSEILVTNLTTLDPRKTSHKFHVCDWIFLGRTVDVKKIFSLSIKPPSHFSWYADKSNVQDNICSQFRTESVLFMHLYDHERLETDNEEKHELDSVNMTLDLFFNDLIIVNHWMIGLKSWKHKKLYLWYSKDRLFFTDWLNSSRHKISIFEKIRESLMISLNFVATWFVKYLKG